MYKKTATLLFLLFITALPALAQSKYTLAVAATMQSKDNSARSFIVVAKNISQLNELLATRSKNITIIRIDEASHAAIIRCKPAVMEELLALDEVLFVDVPAVPHIETSIIGYDRSFHGINALDYMIPGANGKNRVAGVKEQRMEETDLDLFKRVLPSSLAASTISNHATVISSIIGGAGNSFYDGRGMANGCKFYSSSFNNLFPDDIALLNTNNVTVQNHSYGTIIQQFYGAEAVSYDAQTWLNKNLAHVFSAGNQGTAAASEGRYASIAGYANLTGNFKMAKNIMTVGAVNNAGAIPAESSAGPDYDGRLAPQITALGPNGTSDAAAMVTGTVAVLQQVYADSNAAAIAPAALIKALLYNTADDIAAKGIDYKSGFGLLNSYQSVLALQQKKYESSSLAQSQVYTKTFTVPANAAKLKVTLAWTDSTAAINNSKALVNDLDLEVVETSSGTIYRPWVLSIFPHRDSLAKEAVRKRDTLNTAEQVTIDLPAAGSYQFRVTGSRVITPSMPFSIAWNVDTLNTFRFTSPQHASDVNREENPDLTIRWRTFVADTANTLGNLSISYNQGANWQLIKSGIKIYTNQYQWPIKDTASVAMLRMETPFGNFFSKDFIIAPLTRMQVDFACTDSFRLSWNKHVYANGYKLYALVDSPYLKPILNLTDTFVVLQRAALPSRVYAVEPVLSNGLPAARSIAVNTELQGVGCFYRVLNYTLLDGNRLNISLELSIASYVDSVYFENVTQGGQLVKTWGSAKANNAQLIYTHLVSDPIPPGTIYIRGRIKLKNGAIVYTDIVPVLSSGLRVIVFYPNPVDRATPLRYVLRQGVAADSRLQLYDMYGRLVRDYKSIPVQLELSGLPAGVYIYKLSSEGVEERGKVVVE